jgi:UDP-glucose 4-epimerase
MEAVRTNVIGTDNVLRAATQAGVERVVVLSTDKAAYPINAMGISKAMMEKVATASSRIASERGTTICTTRYGNVMASRGSVIPLFMDQIAKGQPLTVTEPEMTRFMMTLDDAVDLVLHAFKQGKPGDLYVQKAPAATIGTLVKAMKELLCVDTPIKIIGMRHGEKLYETLLTREERANAEDQGNYFRVPSDSRDLNYNLYFSEGSRAVLEQEDYHSHNTQRLNVDEMKKQLLRLSEFTDFMKKRNLG